MATLISGRNSVEQDDEVVRRMRRTPTTPVKMTPYRQGTTTQRRRGLFQPVSPASSDSSGGLGHMSPLSSSGESIGSPTFSPNGHFLPETPVKTRSASGISVRSVLFPALQMPKLRRSPRKAAAAGSPSIQESIAMLQDIVGEDSSNVSTPRSSRRSSRRFVAETPSSVGTPPSQRKSKTDVDPTVTVIPATPTTVTSFASHKPQNTNAIQPVSPEDFYSFKPINPNSVYNPSKSVPVSTFYAPAAPRATLAIDAVGSRRARRDSEMSKLSVVTAASKRQRSTSRSLSRSSKRRKGAIPGVWHSIKKPKKLNKNAPKPNPTISPKTRVAQTKEVEQVNSKRLFEEKPKNRVAGKMKELDDDGIIDTFPSPLIKRKKLPTSPLKEPDMSKKFVKYGSRKASFQLFNAKVEFSHGQARVKTPEKRKPLRLRKPPLDPIDFSMPEPETADIQKDVSSILQLLEEGDENAPPTPRSQVVEKMTDEQLLHILESPKTRVRLVPASPSKIMTELYSSPQKTLLANMSSLQLTDDSRMPLSTTGGLLTSAANVLNTQEFSDEDSENNSKYYPVFDTATWKKTSVLTDSSNIRKSERKKKVLVADDQYLLDAGQASIGIVKCKECGVMYQAGDYLDEVAHNNVHNHLTELSFTGWKDERVISKFSDGRIVMVTNSDSKPWQEKAKKVVGVVDLELGFSENSLKWSADKKVFLFVCDKLKQVVGCLVAEKCDKGYRMYPPVEGVEVDTCARDPTPCKIGVSRIWSAIHVRRQRVATRLFQAMARVCGQLDADDVAFSIPSPDGKMLARSVIGRDDFKVYGFFNA